MERMILAVLNFVTDTPKTLTTSLAGVAVGQVANDIDRVNTAFQHAAWTVAILAGILTMINLFFPLRSFYEAKKARKKSTNELD